MLSLLSVCLAAGQINAQQTFQLPPIHFYITFLNMLNKVSFIFVKNLINLLLQLYD